MLILKFPFIQGAGAFCYPQETKILAKGGFDSVKKIACVSYNFVVGARPTVGSGDGKAFEKMRTMASDVGQYSANIFKRGKPAETSAVVDEKEATVEVVTSAPENVTDKPEEVSPIDTVIQANSEQAPDLTVLRTDEASEVLPPEEENSAKIIIEGDMGQGNPEDQEMYTTR